MKPSEFLDVEKKFKEEQLYWESLKPGMTVYESFPRFFDIEYYRHEIISVNVEERVLTTKDFSQQGKIVELRSFSKVEELRAQGITFKEENNGSYAML